jgi:hypothetical protein
LVDSGHKPQVSRATLEGFPQIRVLVLVGVDDATVSENHLKVGDNIASKTTNVGMERVLKSG